VVPNLLIRIEVIESPIYLAFCLAPMGSSLEGFHCSNITISSIIYSSNANIFNCLYTTTCVSWLFM